MRLSSPFVTGEGGATFEQLVASSYLVSILAADVPRGLDWGIAKEVALQHRWSGCLLDDIVVTSSDGNATRKLALQVKHDLTFSDTKTNSDFAQVVKDCWDTYSNSRGWPFNKATDRIGIALGVYQSKLDKHFRPLLELARTSKNSADFFEKASLKTFYSAEKRDYLQTMRSLLSKAKGCDVTDDELWGFLQCLVVLYFDLEAAGSRDSVQCRNRLLDQLGSREEGQARLLFNALTAIVAEYARSAGSLDRNSLRAKIPSSISLKDEQNYSSDLSNLRSFTDRVLENIRLTIGDKVLVPRTPILDALEEAIKGDNEAVIITGEPMVGKSALLRLLANRLRSEGEIIAFSVERFSGVTIESFLQGVGIQHDFKAVLSAIGGAPFRCILIDGLERALYDEDKRRILNDIIITVRNYNESITAKGSTHDYCWKTVFTCRRQEFSNLLSLLDLDAKSMKPLEVVPLGEEEIADVVEQLPKLKVLATQAHLKEILSRPLVLEILTWPYDIVQSDTAPIVLTETLLLDRFWKTVVRLSESSVQGKGHPDKREQVLTHLAEESLGETKFVLIDSSMDTDAVSGLVSDKLLLREGNYVRFAHDVFEDWSLAILLSNYQDKIPEFLKHVGEPLGLARAFRLYASEFLEVRKSPPNWLNLLNALEKEGALSPRWYQIALTAPLFSHVIELIPQMQSYLLDKEGILLSKLLKALRTICVQPDPNVYLIFKDLPRSEFEKYLAYMTVPMWRQWLPVLQIVLQNSDKLSNECSFEFSHITEKWMTTTSGNQLFRKDIVTFSLRVLNGGLLQSYEDQPKNRYVKSVLWAADCLPELVDEFVSKKALRSRDEENYGFEELFLEEGWIPICKHLPKTAVNILGRILCIEIRPDRFGDYHPLMMDYGIAHTKWHPPTYLKGPFLGLLRLHSVEGLDLIQKVTNHATKCWRMMQESELERKPVAQIIKLNTYRVEVWGDEHVFTWYRYPTVAPEAVACALMALEYWMNEQLKNGADPVELFGKVLEGTESVAVVGVCTSVALANERKCLEAVVPILENPAFWSMDVFRFTQDMSAESSIEMFSTYFSLGHDKADYDVLLKAAKEEHRKLDIRTFVLPIVLSGPPEVCERLQKAMRVFPDNPPIKFEQEKDDVHLMNNRIETCRIWAAQAERENYETFEIGEKGKIGIRFRLPKVLEDQQEEKTRLIEELRKLYVLQGWSMNLLDKGEIGPGFTIQSATEYAKELAHQDNPSYQPNNLHEDSELRANSIAAFAAAMVIHHWDWLERNAHTPWCRQQVLTAAQRPESPTEYGDERSHYPFGYRRSAARALPIFLAKCPRDKEIREAIFGLSLHRNNEVRGYLYNAMKSLWTIEQRTIWECINNTIKHSRKRIIYGRYSYLKSRSLGGIRRGRYQDIRRLVTYLIKMPALLIVNNVSPKPISSYGPRDVDTSYLESILYSLPVDSQVVLIPSSTKVIDLLADLTKFTVNAYVQCEKGNGHHNEWSSVDWNRLIFPIIANALLALPKGQDSGMLDTMINNWEKSPALMEELLRNLSLVGAQPVYEDRLVALWLYVGNCVLSSERCTSLGYHLSSEMRNILGLLVFADPTIKWKVQEWAPLRIFTGFIGSWCSKVGHHPDCFPSLVRLLQTIGFNLLPEFGIIWLNDCLLKVKDRNDFFKRSGVANQLGELLHDCWLKQGTSIKNQTDILKRFVYLVDIVAEQGNMVAIRLQSILQGKNSQEGA